MLIDNTFVGQLATAAPGIVVAVAGLALLSQAPRLLRVYLDLAPDERFVARLIAFGVMADLMIVFAPHSWFLR